MIWIFRYYLDEVALLVITMLATWCVSRVIARRYRVTLIRMPIVWAGFAIVISTIFGANLVGKHERHRMQEMVSSIGPLLATEFLEEGHQQIHSSTPADDPEYLKLIEIEKTWLKACQGISDIYTMRRKPDGTLVFVVDSETDYNRDGVFEGDREQRTAIGEAYVNETVKPAIDAGFAGIPGFCDEIYTDRWGSWVTAVQPIFAPDGRIDAIVGIDFPAEQWVANILRARQAVLLMGATFFAIVLGSASVIIGHRHEAILRMDVKRAARSAAELAVRAEELEALVRLRTAELEAERSRDVVRMGKLEELVGARTAELRRAALHDKLTGLPNRAMFFDRLQSAITRAKYDSNHTFAVLFVDLDHFKVINDSLGHDTGDKLLITIGERFTAALQLSPNSSSACLAARLGGDEFAILIEPLESNDAAVFIASRILAALNQPYQLAGREVVTAASIGITYSSIGYDTAEDALRDADLAMYRAKSSGRGRFAIFKPIMHEEAMKRLVFENDLRHALERNELELYYQPIVCLETGIIRGAESLMRWNHRQRGIVSPGEFIPLAEETGQIIELGTWALEKACEILNQLDGVNGPLLPYLSVNISRRQVLEPNFSETVAAILERTRVDTNRIVFELTESTLTHDAELAERQLASLREMGARIYLDDFGTGMSSLGSIRRFPLDGIKLDRSFLDVNESNRRSAAVIHSAITLSRDLGILLIAEGVETYEQVALLQAMSCEFGQGYLFSRPRPLNSLIDLLNQPFETIPKLVAA